jgi:hypothetical protein
MVDDPRTQFRSGSRLRRTGGIIDIRSRNLLVVSTLMVLTACGNGQNGGDASGDVHDASVADVGGDSRDAQPLDAAVADTSFPDAATSDVPSLDLGLA